MDESKQITILGTGRLGTTLADVLYQNGYAIILGSRDPAAASERKAVAKLIEKGIACLPIATAAGASDIVVFAFPWYALVDIEREVGKLEKKIVLDCINPISSSGSLSIGHKRSAGEEIQQTFPLSYVVKGFNHLYVDHFRNPVFDGKPASAFYCSNHDQAKAVFRDLARTLGFDPIDIGPIKHARYLEPLAALWLQMAFHIGMGPDMTFNLISR
ncbi:MAG: NAD(P)-binding domain-containing protein [Chloroflexota bacterium]